MPEGDSLRRAEALLSPILDGQIATDVWFRKIRGHRPRNGQRIERVNAVGKHLLIEFERRITLRTHLGMSGSWRTGPADAKAPADPRLRVLIRTELGTAMCFAAPTIDTFVRDGSPTPIDHLGPDLSNDVADIGRVVELIRGLDAETLLAQALLDQRVSAGIGNVFKSEIAFLAGIHPFTPVRGLSDRTLERIWTIAQTQLVNNRSRSSRKTTSALVQGRTYVYGRFRAPCRRCSDSILFSPAGQVTERSTYWCPRCQGTAGRPPSHPLKP